MFGMGAIFLPEAAQLSGYGSLRLPPPLKEAATLGRFPPRWSY
jgi:hypothetical protein